MGGLMILLASGKQHDLSNLIIGSLQQILLRHMRLQK